MNENEVKEDGEHCGCGGDIDRLYFISRNPDIQQGRCFRCGIPYTVIERQYDKKPASGRRGVSGALAGKLS